MIHSRKKLNNNLILKDQFWIKSDNHVQIIIKKGLNFPVSVDGRSNRNSCGEKMHNQSTDNICNYCQYIIHVYKKSLKKKTLSIHVKLRLLNNKITLRQINEISLHNNKKWPNEKTSMITTPLKRTPIKTYPKKTTPMKTALMIIIQIKIASMATVQIKSFTIIKTAPMKTTSMITAPLKRTQMKTYPQKTTPMKRALMKIVQIKKPK